MKIDRTPEEIWQEYERAVCYNSGIDLYETVRRNENFFIGKQWEGLSAPDLEKPVLNFLKRVVSYFISMIVSDDVAVSLTPFVKTRQGELACRGLSQEIERVMERTNLKSLHRDLLRNMAVDGDGCFYFYYDPQIPNGQMTPGEICVDCIDNTKILFGNPHIWEVQRQPHLFIVLRQTLEAVREEARQNGAPQWELDSIQTDRETKYQEEPSGEADLVTVLVTLYKDPKTHTVWAAKTTRDCVIKGWWDTQYQLYPVAYASWDRIKSSYHGQAAITGLIPNQIFVNKLWAMAMEQQKSMAFPKIIYDRTKFPEGWTNGVGKAIGVNGDPNQAVATGFRAPDMSAQVLELVERTIAYTRDFMGASDAALGNVKPDNTSAIIAVQKASSAPLELQRLAFYQFVEDYARVILDMIRVHYGVRMVEWEESGEAVSPVAFDFSSLSYQAIQLKVDVGSAAYWSELMQIQTLDNLFSKGIIQDAVTYLEGIPESYLKNKNRIITKLREQQSLQEQMLQRQMGGTANAAMSHM